MKEKFSKDDLVQDVANTIYDDLMSGDKASVEGLLFNLSTEDLIKYLPQHLSEEYKVLRL
jgi:hypothetical protein